LIKEVDEVGVGIDNIEDMDIGIVGHRWIHFVVIIVLRDCVVDKSDQTIVLETIVIVVCALSAFGCNIFLEILIDIKSSRDVRLIDSGGEISVVSDERFEGGEIREEGIVIDKFKDVDIGLIDEGEAKEKIALGGGGGRKIKIVDEGLILV
jgi:hypothetical protein